MSTDKQTKYKFIRVRPDDHYLMRKLSFTTDEKVIDLFHRLVREECARNAMTIETNMRRNNG